MRLYLKFLNYVVVTVALSVTISACQSKAQQTVEDIGTYINQNPYLEQSKVEQAKSLQMLTENMNKNWDAKRSNVENSKFTSSYEVAKEQHMLVRSMIMKQSYKPAVLEAVRKFHAEEKAMKTHVNSAKISLS